MDLTFRHPSFESAGAASQLGTLWTASPAAVALLMHGTARQTRAQFVKRWSVPAAVMVALHIVAGVAVLRLVDRPPQPPVPVHELTIALIAPPAPPAVVPVAPPDPKPVPKPTPQPVIKHVTPRPQPVVPPSPVLATQAPAPTTVAAPPATPATPAPAPAKPDAAPTPSTAPSHASSGAPVSVSHLGCEGDPPAYPMLSKRHGESGTAVIAITVDIHGGVTAALRTSSGFPRLDDAALQAARERSCQPYMENGTPVVATALLPFAFRLQD